MTYGRFKERVRPLYLRWLYFRLFPEREPFYFRDCWRYPFERITAATRLDGLANDAADVVFFPMTDWHTRIQRSNHLARALAALGRRCLYLNPHLGREFEKPWLIDRSHRLSRLEENVYELHVRLPSEPVFHHRLLDAGENDRICSAVEQLISKERGAALMVSHPVWLDAARELRRRHGFPILYDCHDLLSSFSDTAAEVLRAEQACLREADLTLFSSELLAELLGGGIPWLLVRNGVDAERFGEARRNGPVAGYVGAIEKWFDADMVREAAVANPGFEFRITGRIDDPAVGTPALPPNVRFTGEAAYADVPALLAGFRVGLIPFRLTPLTRATNPIKLYEYFRCGLPVVSTPLPEVEAMGDLVYIASTPAEFARQVRRAMEEEDEPRRARRIALAGQESWHSRAIVIEAEMHRLIEAGGGRVE